MKIETIPLKEPLKDFQIENCKQWIEALRSGEYIQCSNRLFRHTADYGPSFCCLGVACDIKEMQKDLSAFIYNRRGYDLGPPYEYFSFVYGFDWSLLIANQIINDYDDIMHSSLAELNDKLGLKFTQIADVIEAVAIDRVKKTFEFNECKD